MFEKLLGFRPRLSARVAVLLFLLSSFAYAAPPRIVGTDVICYQTRWTNALVFILANFVSHVATVPQNPGVKWYIALQWSIIAFFLPFVPLCSTVGRLGVHFLTRNDPLSRAGAAGALITVSRRENWTPTEEVSTTYYLDPHTVSAIENTPASLNIRLTAIEGDMLHDKHFQIHGSYQLPEGYCWQCVSHEEMGDMMTRYLGDNSGIEIAKTQSWVKMFAGIAQAIYGCVSLYQVRGFELQKFGYAAFGLYVFPFVLMSIINLLCVGAIGDYPALYMVRTPVMEEAEARGGVFKGVVGTLKSPAELEKLRVEWNLHPIRLESKGGLITVTTSNVVQKRVTMDPDGPDDLRVPEHCNDVRSGIDKQWHFGFLPFVLVVICCILPYVFIYSISKFESKESKPWQRGWLMAWTVCNQIATIFPGVLLSWKSLFPADAIGSLYNALVYLAVIPLSVPAVGGYVTMIKEMFEIETCSTF